MNQAYGSIDVSIATGVWCIYTVSGSEYTFNADKNTISGGSHLPEKGVEIAMWVQPPYVGSQMSLHFVGSDGSIKCLRTSPISRIVLLHASDAIDDHSP